MNPCIECGTDSVPEQVYESVQVYECKNGHRWGVIGKEKETEQPLIKAA